MSDFIQVLRQFIEDLNPVSAHILPFNGCLPVDHKVCENNICFHLIPLKSTVPSDFCSKFSDYFASKNRKIVHIWEDVYWRNRVLIGSRIQALLGQSKRIAARKTQVIRLNKAQANYFFADNHLQGSANAAYALGLTYQDKLICSASFSTKRTLFCAGKAVRCAQPIRFASLQNHLIVGG